MTLEALGYVEQDAGRFALTPKVMEIGLSYLGSTEWWNIATPHMECVSAEVNEACSASVLDGTEIVYAARVPGNRVMSVVLSLGARLPAYCTSMGRVLLAAEPEERARAVLEASDRTRKTPQTLIDIEALTTEIQKVRDQGFSLVDQELESGLRSIAVPLVNARGRTLAAINISSHASRSTIAQMTGPFLDALRRAAEAIRERLP